MEWIKTPLCVLLSFYLATWTMLFFLLFLFSFFFSSGSLSKISFSFFLHSPCASDIEGDKIFVEYGVEIFFVDGKAY